MTFEQFLQWGLRDPNDPTVKLTIGFADGTVVISRNLPDHGTECFRVIGDRVQYIPPPIYPPIAPPVTGG